MWGNVCTVWPGASALGVAVPRDGGCTSGSVRQKFVRTAPRDRYRTGAVSFAVFRKGGRCSPLPVRTAAASPALSAFLTDRLQCSRRCLPIFQEKRREVSNTKKTPHTALLEWPWDVLPSLACVYIPRVDSTCESKGGGGLHFGQLAQAHRPAKFCPLFFLCQNRFQSKIHRGVNLVQNISQSGVGSCLKHGRHIPHSSGRQVSRQDNRRWLLTKWYAVSEMGHVTPWPCQAMATRALPQLRQAGCHSSVKLGVTASVVWVPRQELPAPPVR